MLEIFVTETFARLYKKLPSSVRTKADSKTKIFAQNPFHPSLRAKKLAPRQKEMWSFWIDKDYRIKFIFVNPKTVHLLFIGNRKDIYR